jgi:hypothetical protein
MHRFDRLWGSLLPARPIEGCLGAWELKGPPRGRGRFIHFGVDPGEELARADVGLWVSVRRHDERSPFGGGHREVLLWYPILAHRGRNIRSLEPEAAIITPALPDNAASLIVTVWDRGHLAEGVVEVRAR